MRPEALESLSRWTVERGSTVGLRPAELSEVARIIGDARDPNDPGGPTACAEHDWAFIGRWPIVMRLGVLRILDELGWLATLKRKDPATHDALVGRLRGDE
jgi:hypothetical protein